MPELLESVAMTFPDIHKPEDCPFCQDGEPDTDDRKTIYEGKSGDLAKSLEKAGYKSPEGDWSIKWSGSDDVHSVPNAHHLIPAEAALHGKDGHSPHPCGQILNKQHRIMQYMSKNANNSKVKADIGYNVNAKHNGIWLPSIPKEFKETKVKNEESGKMVPADPQPDGFISKWIDLTTEKQTIAEAFMMKLSGKQGYYGSQWHQTHKKYSKQVETWLENFYKKLDKWNLRLKCPVCENESDEDGQLPPPMGLLQRLRNLSRECRQYLEGDKSDWTPPMFASTQAAKYHKKT